MTNHWIDYQNSDVFINIGLNTAENHPVSMKWIEKAQEENDAKLVCVDPRYTRTAAVSDLYVPMRPGTNIAFLAGLINYVLENKKYNEDYIKNFTNASYLIDPEFDFADGMFSGAQKVNNRVAYDKKSWAYQQDEEGDILKDESLEDPNCVFQLMKKHYSRYDINTVCNITGSPEDKYEELCQLYAETGAPEKAGNIMYAMGITQFTHGSQNVRSIAMLQLLLGNMGIAGGGVNAQRGQSNVQGACDTGMLFHLIPGYMGVPRAELHPTLADYLDVETPETGYWENKPSFFVSLLKAFYGENATEDNDFCYDYLPKMDDKDRSHIGIFNEMKEGNIEGLISWADNPAVSGPSAGDQRQDLGNLDWLVAVDIFETETASFWKEPGVDSKEIKTEVFLLPAAMHLERAGSITNSGRWIQWRHQSLDPPEDAKSDLWIADRIFKAVRNLYEEEEGVKPEPIVEMNWDYGEEPDPELVARELNGYHTEDKKLVADFTKLASDGSTAAGSWIYSGYFADKDDPATMSRLPEAEGIGSHHDWAYAWPLNRRIIYNRAGADAKGKPWNKNTPVIWWENGAWQKNDVPDFNASLPPEETANAPFIMLPEFQARLFAPGLAGGPFPEHYEPWESPIQNLISGTQFNPAIQEWYPEQRAKVGSKEYPYVATSYRVTEHYQTGMLTRNMPWLNEAMPDLFVEISPSLARKLNVESGEQVIVSSPRGEIEAAACVTPRLKPFAINNNDIEMVGIVWHWGYAGMSTGPVANDLSPAIGDPNTTIPEYKAFLCNIQKKGESK